MYAGNHSRKEKKRRKKNATHKDHGLKKQYKNNHRDHPMVSREKGFLGHHYMRQQIHTGAVGSGDRCGQGLVLLSHHLEVVRVQITLLVPGPLKFRIVAFVIGISDRPDVFTEAFMLASNVSTLHGGKRFELGGD